MALPFTREAFFNVFSEYNGAVWPFQVLLVALGIAIATFAFVGLAHKLTNIGLAILWIWMGLMYHVAFYSTINSLALAFGALFVLQGGLFAAYSARLRYKDASVLQRTVGITLVVYGMFLYPVVGWYVGQDWPALPIFTLPCPTTIFTLGLLCLLERPFPMTIVIIPVLWSAIGTSAAITLDVPEDFGLPVAAILTLLVLVLHRKSEPANVLAKA